MEKRVVIIDSSREMHILYQNTLEGTDYKITGIAADGYRGISLIHDNRPDIVVMELILPHMDGFEVLNHIADDPDLQMKPSSLVVSAAGREDIIEQAFNCGASYYMIKPLDSRLFIRRLDSIFENRLRLGESLTSRMRIDYAGDSTLKSLEEKVSQILRAMAVPPHIKGYQYLKDCIMIATERKECINAVTKDLYPAVAKMNSTTGSSVERAVRHAIEVTFRREHSPTLLELFSYSLYRGKQRPTSAEFIAVVADRIRTSLSWQ